MTLLEDCHSSGNLRALDIVEVNPDLGDVKEAATTVSAAKHLILSALGYKRGAHHHK